MQYGTVVPARFLQRPNRFIAHAALEPGGEIVVAHVRNTGRCRELLVPGTRVYLEHAPHPGRKTAYSLLAVEKESRLINMDSQAPNRVVAEALSIGWVPEGIPRPVTDIRREFVHGGSRFDFRFLAGGEPVLLEVKGVTLEEGGRVYFPDAPTERGVKHLRHLTDAAKSGAKTAVVFVVQMSGVASFSPNDRTHPAFGDALRAAAVAGVHISAWDCAVSPDSIRLGGPVPVIL